MTEKSPASAAHNEQQTLAPPAPGSAQSVQPVSLSGDGAPMELRSASQPDGQPQPDSKTSSPKHGSDGSGDADTDHKQAASPSHSAVSSFLKKKIGRVGVPGGKWDGGE